ncbi:uncharacterized beta-barrel protein YwiB (DUF1934 family) [Hazenella coriacea]|uniref:Uncharacterized beta-barrel protein YwiB (DUF1934 family) n=1 Tax=Hazenella coriacea TaxID=1179467 RepID=A0A4R3L7M9_9BACL|nr:uncharacterized beta-barrel protein YwiB (DUF1934 family) [Hazenella coriacea]
MGLIPVEIQICSTIRPEGEQEPEIIRQQVKGKLTEKGEEWVLRYMENENTSEEVRTSVKSHTDQVTVVRQGSVSYRQTYQPGASTESMVYTPAGNTEMYVETLIYGREGTPQQGQIFFSFLLSMGGQRLGTYQLELVWKEDQTSEST